ncbi:hypothetical protein IWW43_002824 [Coemansia sp. RSA 1935]|nr:hypothetical protein IWW43_002824 [Coemansia sp. RSA 1935]KAJ2730138.1 hypothetical protein H4S00_000101 [Coemansia sp. D1744]
MLRSSVLALLALAIAPLVVLGAPQATTSGADTCPPSTSCYNDEVMPECPPDNLCAQVMSPVIACKWTCGNTKLPSGCKQRCKPCKQEICTEECQCEIVCDVNGPCKAT